MWILIALHDGPRQVARLFDDIRIGAALASAGVFAIGNWIPLAVPTAMPYGVAWIAIGMRIVGGAGGGVEPGLATTGGPAARPAA